MAKKQYQVLWEDEHLLVAEKASGLLTIPDRYKADIPNLYHLLHQYRTPLSIYLPLTIKYILTYILHSVVQHKQQLCM